MTLVKYVVGNIHILHLYDIWEEIPDTIYIRGFMVILCEYILHDAGLLLNASDTFHP